ncbi:hypothetical protein DM860_014824 [Cuscuta australis]|uniref:Uncharacterized protein n=1 Tax=Cuscuta australis TaxID=267555 RepID=A0A328DI14_9ASTE|nr:hypothetical protein DM860_014824 [Cuscuta australis]
MDPCRLSSRSSTGSVDLCREADLRREARKTAGPFPTTTSKSWRSSIAVQLPSAQRRSERERESISLRTWCRNGLLNEVHRSVEEKVRVSADLQKEKNFRHVIPAESI